MYAKQEMRVDGGILDGVVLRDSVFIDEIESCG